MILQHKIAIASAFLHQLSSFIDKSFLPLSIAAVFSPDKGLSLPHFAPSMSRLLSVPDPL